MPVLRGAAAEHGPPRLSQVKVVPRRCSCTVRARSPEARHALSAPRVDELELFRVKNNKQGVMKIKTASPCFGQINTDVTTNGRGGNHGSSQGGLPLPGGCREAHQPHRQCQGDSHRVCRLYRCGDTHVPTAMLLQPRRWRWERRAVFSMVQGTAELCQGCKRRDRCWWTRNRYCLSFTIQELFFYFFFFMINGFVLETSQFLCRNRSP